LIVGNTPWGLVSFRLGCGGENINSAQRRNEEIRGTEDWFPVLFKDMLWQKFLVQIATEN
jgi:hypothetical protein